MDLSNLDGFSHVEGGFRRPWVRVYTCPHCGDEVARVPLTEDEVYRHLEAMEPGLRRLREAATYDGRGSGP